MVSLVTISQLKRAKHIASNKHHNTIVEPNSSHVYKWIEGRVQPMLWRRSVLQRGSSETCLKYSLENLDGMKAWTQALLEVMDSSSLNVIPSYSIFSSSLSIVCIILPVQISCTKRDSFFYRGKGGGWDPYKGGRESYPLGEFQGRWKPLTKGRSPWFFQFNHSHWLIVAVVGMEPPPLF